MRLTARDVFQKGYLFLQLTRPIFLAGGALLYAYGAACAAAAGYSIDWRKYLIGQFLVTCVQLFAQYSNEYFDVDADRLNSRGRTWFSGGSGVLPSGKLPAETALHAARTLGVIALALVFGLATENPLVSLIGFLALAGAWYYTAPPLKLVSSGFGEIVATIIVCVMVPFTAALLQTGNTLPPYLAGIAPLCLLHTAMLLVFALPDRDADLQVGKTTLAVRLGYAKSGVVHNGLILLAFIILAVLSVVATPPARFAWAALPLGIWQMKSVSDYVRNPGDHPNLLSLGAVALPSLFAVLLVLDIFLSG